MATKKQPHSAMTQMAASLTKPASVAAVKVRKSGARPELQRINSPKTNQGRNELFKEGGDTMKDDIKQDKGMMQKAVNKHEGRLHKGQPMTKLAKGGKAKRFDEGGEVQDDATGVDEAVAAQSMRTAAEEQPAAKPSSFKEAFAAARKGGGKTFEFNGKKYTTELASTSGPGRSPAGAKVPSGPGRTPTGSQKTVQAQSAKNQADRRAKYSTDSLDRNTLLPKKMASGGSTGSFRSSANGIAQRGKTRGKMC